jgi:hypothetical protein
MEMKQKKVGREEDPKHGQNQEKEEPIVIKDSMIPIKNSEVTIREEMEEDGKYMLFNEENELILVINSSGKFILENCDGEKSVTQLIEDIENNYSVNEDIYIPEIVKNFMGTLLKAKLVKIKREE